jgi:hypothetical protein
MTAAFSRGAVEREAAYDAFREVVADFLWMLDCARIGRGHKPLSDASPLVRTAFEMQAGGLWAVLSHDFDIVRRSTETPGSAA